MKSYDLVHFLNINMSTLWIILIIVFSLIELAGPAIVSIWFVGGAVLALILSLLGFSVPVQFFVFLVSSIIFLMFARKFAIKYLKVGKVKTNVDEVIGKVGIVTKKISKFEYGKISLKGVIWTAKSIDDRVLEIGEEVEILSVEGVKLIVKALNS